MSTDPLVAFKEAQKQSWSQFFHLESATTPSAARLVSFAGVKPGDHVLDVACGTGVVAVTAARLGAKVSGLDLTPQLIERARENSRLADVEIDWREGDVEQLPYQNDTFDVVLSQFGHIFAPRPEVAMAEMLRVLKPQGTIAFSTWPPELFTARGFALVASYLPPPPPGVSPPPQWGNPDVVRERLGSAVTDLVFDRDLMRFPALSPQHFQTLLERVGGPMRKLVEHLTTADPDRLGKFRAEYGRLVRLYFRDNFVRQGYLMTRATKI
jgi:SAM-dependent methyltransferase